MQSIEMTPDQRRALKALRELPLLDSNGNDPDYEDEDINLGDILDGSAPLDISHGGGEFNELRKALRANLSGKTYVM